MIFRNDLKIPGKGKNNYKCLLSKKKKKKNKSNSLRKIKKGKNKIILGNIYSLGRCEDCEDTRRRQRALYVCMYLTEYI